MRTLTGLSQRLPDIFEQEHQLKRICSQVVNAGFPQSKDARAWSRRSQLPGIVIDGPRQVALRGQLVVVRLPDKRRPVLVLTRDDVIDHLNEIIVVPATRTNSGIDDRGDLDEG